MNKEKIKIIGIIFCSVKYLVYFYTEFKTNDMTTKEEQLIKEQRQICQKNKIQFKFKKLFDEWWIFVPSNFSEDLRQLGYKNVDILSNF